MKKVGILFAILFLLTSCTSGTVSEDPPCPVEDDRQSTLQELLAENPIDASIKLPTTDPSNREDHKEILQIQNQLVDAWRNEMISVYRELRDFIPEKILQQYRDAQLGFETHLRNEKEVCKYAFGLEQDEENADALIALYNYEIEQYQRRTAELIRSYNQLSPVPYTFLYPKNVDTVTDCNQTPVTFTREDFDCLRKEYYYIFRTDILYNNPVVAGTGFLEIDGTAGRLEQYLNCVLGEALLMGKGIPQELTNDLIYLAAASNTDIARGYNPYWELVPGMHSSLIMKEHIEETARYLFGEDCKIDFENLQEMGRYIYHDYFGVTTIEGGIIKESYHPVVVSYQDCGDFYEVEIVLLYWTSWNPPGYFYIEEDFSHLLTEDEAKEYYRNMQPRYTVHVLKGENDGLYLQCG